MKKVTLYIASTIDGFIARKNKSVDWLDKFNNDNFLISFSKFAPNLTRLDFAGGEPLIDPFHYKILHHTPKK
jgi:hypothetical protein